METNEKDPVISIWVVGEVGVPESKIKELGVEEAVQEALANCNFSVTYAEPV